MEWYRLVEVLKMHRQSTASVKIHLPLIDWSKATPKEKAFFLDQTEKQWAQTGVINAIIPFSEIRNVGHLTLLEKMSVVRHLLRLRLTVRLLESEKRWVARTFYFLIRLLCVPQKPPMNFENLWDIALAPKDMYVSRVEFSVKNLDTKAR